MRTDYGKVDLGAGVRGKYLKDNYFPGDLERAGGKPAKPGKAAQPARPRSRKRR